MGMLNESIKVFTVYAKNKSLENVRKSTEPLKGHGEKKILETFYVRT